MGVCAHSLSNLIIEAILGLLSLPSRVLAEVKLHCKYTVIGLVCSASSCKAVTWSMTLSTSYSLLSVLATSRTRFILRALGVLCFCQCSLFQAH